MMSYIKPYHPDWARLLDFITPLNLQQAIDPHVEVNYFKGEVSVPMAKLTGQLKPEVKTQLGIIIKQDHISRRKTIISFGSVDVPQIRVSQRELWQSILENTITDEVPAVIGKEVAYVETVSGKLGELQVLDGCDAVYRLQKSYGHFAGVLRRRLGLPIINPCVMIRNDLTFHGYTRYDDGIFRRMRSIWRTEWLIGLPRKGWSDIGSQGVADISVELTRDKFHQDVGIPQEIRGQIDSIPLKEQIYKLLKRGELIAIG